VRAAESERARARAGLRAQKGTDAGRETRRQGDQGLGFRV